MSPGFEFTRRGKCHAATIHPATVVRGSLGVSLEDLGITSTVGALSLYLNGGLALLCSALAAIVVRANMADTWMRLSTRTPIGH
jgi:hypothetical protein